MNKLILAVAMTLSTQSFADVLAECEVDLMLEDGTVVDTSTMNGQAETEAASIDLTYQRSVYSCRVMYARNQFGDQYDCPLSLGSKPYHPCGGFRPTYAPPREPHLPNPPVKAKCLFKENTCQFSSVPGEG